MQSANVTLSYEHHNSAVYGCNFIVYFSHACMVVHRPKKEGLAQISFGYWGRMGIPGSCPRLRITYQFSIHEWLYEDFSLSDRRSTANDRHVRR